MPRAGNIAGRANGSWRHAAFAACAGLFLPLACPSAASAEEAPAPAEDLSKVLASVDGVPIQLGEVRRELEAVLHDRRPEAAREPRLVRKMLQQIVDRRHALAALVAEGRAASDEEVERVVAARRQQLADRGELLDDHLKKNGVAPASYRQRVQWELSWAAYKREMLSEENLLQFFERHRRHFDGTEVRASHILMRHPKGTRESGMRNGEQDSENSAIRDLRAKLEGVRASIDAGEMTFAEAAARYSVAPSRDRGGDIGYFPRRGVMHEDFAAAAFGLQPGEISSPVTTPFGVHLIQVTAEKPGKRPFDEVREEVHHAADARLFETLVTRGRKRTEPGGMP